MTLNPNGSFSYDPNDQFEYLQVGETASDRFDYTMMDSQGASDTATVIVTIDGVNDEETLVTNAGVTLDQGTALTITTVELEATDVDNSTSELVYSVSSAPMHGRLLLDGTELTIGGTFTQQDIDESRLSYEHDNSVTTSDGFAFTVDDGAGTVSSGTFAITVTLLCAPDPLVVTTTADIVAMDCETSLREAITFANANPGPDTITFFVAGTFSITSPLPSLSDSTGGTTMDGSSAPGFVDAPVVVLQGPGTASFAGLEVTSASNTIHALQIASFWFGINITGSDATGNVVTGCYVGTNGVTTASNPYANDWGIRLDNADDNRIGTNADDLNDAAEANVISGNLSSGIRVVNDSTGNTIAGNYIGTNADGSAPLLAGGTSGMGISFWRQFSNEPSANTVGGTHPAARNIISGHNDAGIDLYGWSHVLIQGNLIGTDATGTNAIGNEDGVNLHAGAKFNQIGGTAPGAGNLISGNDVAGIRFTHATSGNNVVEGNLIGTDQTGFQPLGNNTGITFNLSNDNTIGGTAANAGNIISGNRLHGIRFGNTTGGNDVLGNDIGTTSDGVTALGNGGHGVSIYISSNVLVGGSALGAANVIAFNSGDGVRVEGDPGDINNRISSNSIHSNAGLGINLGTDAVTPNDPDDVDTGPNGLQNYPEIAVAASVGGSTTLEGTLNSTADTTLTLEFFANLAADPSGHGEGQTLIGSALVTTDSSGDATFSVVFTPALTAGQWITATATDPTGNTSEFSGAVLVGENHPPVVDDQNFTVNENSTTGCIVGTVIASDPDPGNNLSFVVTNGDPGGLFAIDASGQITTTAPLDHEAQEVYTLTVTVQDGGTPSLGDTATITVNVLDVNEMPTVGDDTFAIPENEPAGTVVGTVTASDPDDGGEPFGALTYTVVGGPFAIDASGQITTTAPLDHEAQEVYTLTVTVQDGGTPSLSDTAAITVNVLDVNEMPTVGDDTFAIDENSSYGTSVGSVTATDPDDGDVLSYSIIGGTGTTAFDINSSTGEITVLDPVQLDYETTPVFWLDVEVTDTAGLKDTATITINLNDLVEGPGTFTISGRVFDDLDNNGLFEPTNGETGIGGVELRLLVEVSGSHIATAISELDGSYSFVDVPAGRYRLAEVQPEGYLDGIETAGTAGGFVDNSQDFNEIRDMVLGNFDGTGYLFGEILPSSLQGLVWEDFNNDGEVDFGEMAAEGTTITLTGTDDRGNNVMLSQDSNGQGIFEFVDLRPGNYTLNEAQPAGYVDGKDVVGEVNGVLTGDHDGGTPALSTINDAFAGVVLPRPNSSGVNYNFGERIDGGALGSSQTATIGFWQNKNGKQLVENLNGNVDSTLLAEYLGTTFPNMYGVDAGPHNLLDYNGDGTTDDPFTNRQVHSLYKVLFKRNAKNSPGGPPKLDAQVMAVAMATYVTKESHVSVNYVTGTTDPSLVATVESVGFHVTAGGLGSQTFNVGIAGEAFGVANHTDVRIIDLLLATNRMSLNGLLYDDADEDGTGDGEIDSFERMLRSLANDVYTAINELGHI